MPFYDVFNGDADGICALIQLRLAEPRQATLVTGVKRDISLVKQVPVASDAKVTVLDISLEKNREGVDALLAAGAEVFYVDHHFPGDSLPQAQHFTALIDTQATTCTSLLVDTHLKGQYRNWAITAAFGDNLNAVATELAQQAGLTEQQTAALQQLGVCINYNGYGAALTDLHFHPAELFRCFVQYDDPLALITANPEAWAVLRQGYQDDMANGLAAPALHDSANCYVVKLPDEPWARRVSGVLGNELANQYPSKACAIVTDNPSGDYLVSIRAPLQNRQGAVAVARQFATGGGREAAAGINALPVDQLDALISAMTTAWA